MAWARAFSAELFPRLQALKLQGSIAAMYALSQILAPESWHYQRRGYQVFRGAFPINQILAIADMARQLIPPCTGKLRRQDGNFAANEVFPGTQLVKNSPLHPHLPLPGGLEPLSSVLHALVTSPALAKRLRLLDGVNHYIIHQALLFFAAQTTDLNLDSWSVDTAPLGHTHTVWIPLQDLLDQPYDRTSVELQRVTDRFSVRIVT